MGDQSFRPSRAWLLTYLKKYRGLLLLGSFCELVSVALSLTIPRVIGRAIDHMGQAGVTYQSLWQAAATIMGVTVVSGIFFYLQQRTMVTTSRHIDYDLRQDFYAHLQRLPLEFYQSRRIGDLMARSTSDLGMVRQLVGQAIIYIERSLFRVLIVVPFMLLISVKLTLLLLITMPLVSLTVRYFGRRIRERFEDIQSFFGEISSRTQENLTGVRVVRAYMQEQNEIDEYRRLNHEYVDRNLRLVRLSAVLRPLIAVLTGLGFVAIFWVGGGETVRGRMTVGDFVAFNLYFGQLIWPLTAIGYITNVLQRGAVSVKRIHDIMLVEPAISDGPNTRSIDVKGAIEFRDLTFRYTPDGPPVLNKINLVVEPGKVVAFAGQTGSGKSTLMNLIPRLLDAEPGMVLIDGHPIRELSLQQLRASIGYVPQETVLFSETLAENIAFGAPEARPVEIEKAGELAGLSEDVHGFPEGYQTLVGERGITLSGGQKQRTAIARAVIRRPRILVLDDALSAVDTYTEQRILEHLRDVMRQQTTLIVSHRISTIKDADLICVLDHGEIVMRGTHDELMRAGGKYVDLCERQALEEQIAAT
ncbi:MAG TPA: ABC transporter ATP-binding protein [Pyrinomonadaceae bacterium]|nr:ABC transporter ATP-binding protein [Pyrinomonadaceae bacterium]